jgi:hypothetical protein
LSNLLKHSSQNKNNHTSNQNAPITRPEAVAECGDRTSELIVVQQPAAFH